MAPNSDAFERLAKFDAQSSRGCATSWIQMITGFTNRIIITGRILRCVPLGGGGDDADVCEAGKLRPGVTDRSRFDRRPTNQEASIAAHARTDRGAFTICLRN